MFWTRPSEFMKDRRGAVNIHLKLHVQKNYYHIHEKYLSIFCSCLLLFIGNYVLIIFIGSSVTTIQKLHVEVHLINLFN